MINLVIITKYILYPILIYCSDSDDLNLEDNKCLVHRDENDSTFCV